MSTALPSLLSGARLGIHPVLGRRGVQGLAIALGLVAAAALLERSASPLGATDRALQAAAFGLVLPVLVFRTVGLVLRSGRLGDTASLLARFGSSRRWVAFGLVAGLVVAGSVAGALLGPVVPICARDPGAPPLPADVLSTAWIGALSGAAYASLFAWGSTYGKRGRGRHVLWVFDFLLGGAPGTIAFLLPRGHALNLLGGTAPDRLSQPASALALLTMTCAFAAFASWRVPP